MKRKTESVTAATENLLHANAKPLWSAARICKKERDTPVTANMFPAPANRIWLSVTAHRTVSEIPATESTRNAPAKTALSPAVPIRKASAKAAAANTFPANAIHPAAGTFALTAAKPAHSPAVWTERHTGRNASRIWQTKRYACKSWPNIPALWDTRFINRENLSPWEKAISLSAIRRLRHCREPRYSALLIFRRFPNACFLPPSWRWIPA